MEDQVQSEARVEFEPALKTLVELLKRVHATAQQGCAIRSGGAKYGNASIHFAALLHRALTESSEVGKQIGALMRAVATTEESCSELQKIVQLAPEL